MMMMVMMIIIIIMTIIKVITIQVGFILSRTPLESSSSNRDLTPF